MRGYCVICKMNCNCEELADCIKCKEYVCQECVIFQDGNYYCAGCII